MEQSLKLLQAQVDKLEQECDRLKAENEILINLLDQHGIPVPVTGNSPGVELVKPAAATPENNASLSVAEKLALFRRLFRGRTDVYPIRWESRNGKSGYSPACANEWRVGICEKPRIKCSDCSNRQLLPITDQVIFNHLAGRITAGIYPLMPDDTCYFLAVDFDDADWRVDAQGFMLSCHELKVPAALEISRSGSGAHVWIFFTGAVPACDARRLGTALISHTCARTRQLKLSSYDRLFPNQDTLPKGGFGNLIALPLQKGPRANGYSVFVDENLNPHPDQWAFLASIRLMSFSDLENAVQQVSGDTHPLDVSFITEEDQQEPWKRPRSQDKLPGSLPEHLKLTLANQIYIAKADLPQPLLNRLVRLAAFQNPEFYKAQAMRLPVWNKPRVIGCAENFPNHIALPRGSLDSIIGLLKENDIQYSIQDERYAGEPVKAMFSGKLRQDQEAAVKDILKYEFGVLCAPTAFGKTVTAAAIIARRGVSTLVLVHRTELLKQWQERLRTFLEVDAKSIGILGGGKNKLTGLIDIAVMQSISRNGEISEAVEQYGHVIVDECHHLSAFSFEAILKRSKARFILGLTATPVRRDGQHPIIFMQCGPVRHSAARPENAPSLLEVWPRYLDTRFNASNEVGIQEIFRQLASDQARNQRIIADVLSAYQEGRRIIVLTERTDHLAILNSFITGQIEHLFVLHGRMSKKQRAEVFAALEALDEKAPRVLLATGRLIGEGFDHPPLDTLALAMPISWKGTLLQYVGRLHREHTLKETVRVYDYVDADCPPLARMWGKRQRGYRTMGYEIAAASGSNRQISFG